MNFEKPKEFVKQKVEALLGQVAVALNTIEEGCSAHITEAVDESSLYKVDDSPLNGAILNQPKQD